MDDAVSPELSVVIVTPDDYETIRHTMKCLRSQSAHRRMEIVLVAPSARRLNVNRSEFSGFAAFRMVEVGTITSIGAANAAGVRHASAPVVVLAEDHAFPNPDWAKVLVEAHRNDWAAVGPVVRNANPGSIISRADFLIAYGVWQEGVAGGVVEYLPGHNSSYKRAILLDYGPELDIMLEAETVLHWDLTQKGHRLYLEPRAKISHLNFGVISSWLAAQFYSGRMFAAIRSREWSALQKFIYSCAAPVIPLIRFRRILRQANPLLGRLPLNVYPVLLLGLTVSALGEMAGYAMRAGQARKHLVRLEFHRVRHIGRRAKALRFESDMTSNNH